MVDVLVQVTQEAIDPGNLATGFYCVHPDAAVATFAGFVRDFNDFAYAIWPSHYLHVECVKEKERERERHQHRLSHIHYEDRERW